MKKRTICLLLCLALMLAVFAGCGQNAQTTDVESAGEASASEVAAPGAEAPDEEAVASAEETAQEEVPALEDAHSLPLVEDDTTLTMFVAMNPNLMNYIETYAETGMFRWLEETTGVHIDAPAMHPASQAEQMSLMLASGDYADIIDSISSYSGGPQGALDDEIVVDLKEYQDSMPYYFSVLNRWDDVRQAATLDSGAVINTCLIYGNDDFYSFDAGPMIRTDWLEELNLEVPHTYDEYYNVLTAFKEKYGAQLWMSGNASSFLSFGYGVRAGYTFGMMSGLDCWYLEDGTVKCGFLEDGFKDYLAMMQKWYSEGLIYPDYFTVDGAYANGNSDAFAGVTGGTLGVWYDEAKGLGAYDGQNISIGGSYFPVKEEGDTLTLVHGKKRLTQNRFGVSTTCSDIELACQWLDMWYSEEGSQVANWGVEGEAFNYDENGNPVYTDLILNNPDGITMGLACDLYTAPSGGYLNDQTTDTLSWSDTAFDAVEVWETDVNDSDLVSDFISLTAEETEEQNTYLGDIITYVSTELTKFITGESNLEGDLETFQQTLKTMGIETCMEIQQAAYDRFLQR